MISARVAIVSNIAVALGLSAISVSAFSQSVCDVVLSSNAFDTSDYQFNSQIVSKTRDDACKADYDSQGDAVSAGSSAGGNLGYAGFEIGVNEAKQSASNKWHIRDSKFCNASLNELQAETSISAKKQVANIAVKSWLKCIEGVATNRLFIRYDRMPDGSGLTGHIERHVVDGNFSRTITGIMTAGGKADSSVSCNIDGVHYAANTEMSYEIKKTPIAFTCRKDTSLYTKMAFNTDYGDLEFMVMPSAAAEKKTTIDQANEAIKALREEVVALEKRFEETKTKLTVRMAVEEQKSTDQTSALASATADLNGRLSGAVMKGTRVQVQYQPTLNLCLFARGGNGGDVVTGDCGNNNHAVFTIVNTP